MNLVGMVKDVVEVAVRDMEILSREDQHEYMRDLCTTFMLMLCCSHLRRGMELVDLMGWFMRYVSKVMEHNIKDLVVFEESLGRGFEAELRVRFPDEDGMCCDFLDGEEDS